MHQGPTCVQTHVRTTHEARVIFHSVATGRLPMVTRRLDSEERRAIASGSVYVWEERTSYSDQNSSSAIERWTDSIQWGPSRVKDEFLFYHEKDSSPTEVQTIDNSTSAIYRYHPSYRREPLVKQTYSVYVTTAYGQKKWHLIAYFTQNSLPSLYSICNHPFYPQLYGIQPPPNRYKSARLSRLRSGASQQSHRYLVPEPSLEQPMLPESNTPPRFLPPPGDSSGTDSSRSSPSPGPPAPSLRRQQLAPLDLLQGLAPPARHPIDERAIMSFPLEEFLTHPSVNTRDNVSDRTSSPSLRSTSSNSPNPRP